MTKKLLEPIFPGGILLEEFMKPLGVSINKLAWDIHVPPGRISDRHRQARQAGVMRERQSAYRIPGKKK